MSLTLYLPLDAAALALGADEVARALQTEAEARGLDLMLKRTGTRGMVWLEPLLEIEENGLRMGFGPLEPADVPALFEGAFEDHPKALGPVEEIPFFARQTRLAFARCGIAEPLDLDAYRAQGGLKGLDRAMTMTPEEIVAEITTSGLRGRGGAGFPTGIKWKTVLEAGGARKAVVCNADEGDSGTFADRMLIEGDPFCLIEGMAICARAVGADRGYVYMRSEYPQAIATLDASLRIAREAGILGDHFDIEDRVGAGSYVCGEETALLNSMEGKRGTVRPKPPLPAHKGFMGRPTVVNNLITLASVPAILSEGAEHYRSFGLGRSLGTVPLQIAGNVRRGGLFEAAFGMTIGELVEGVCGGTASGRPVKAVQIGGPLGAYFPRSLFDTPLGYEECDEAGGLIGHAGLVVFDDTAEMGAMARFAMEFCAVESCGTCTPCRIGAVRGMETIDRILAGDPAAPAILTDLCETMRAGSLCALGGFTPYPVESALRHFPEDFAPAREAAE
ncbi:NADH-ubiquinone oxidoreductase-F iron-sulfur binding region domain-containing protein [Rhodovulum sulfidophilum]|uniref:NADH-ubiquinone oxidoreductase-F iron-sulfur binding region domain-containing protein n=1 Tax=Rhodovulum sulfidophilum TaxID=35806 RepID=UPI001F367AEF|nr:NADH-ubiquinone oxidoreductase-F iron-sulfur binding region domain-containing protein [Rhodovulum sulfidophilum]MCE8439681.1 formate dehydrogenase [Rhodovulum sulfidophilum]